VNADHLLQEDNRPVLPSWAQGAAGPLVTTEATIPEKPKMEAASALPADAGMDVENEGSSPERRSSACMACD
jgi:hypothetical protein